MIASWCIQTGCISSTVIFIAAGCAFTGADSGPERSYFDKVNVRSFRQTSQGSESWPGSKSIYGTYIGPAITRDINTIVSAPGLRLTSPPAGITPQPSDIVYPFAQGKVSANCGVLLDKFRRNMQPPSSWHISTSQLKLVRQGRMDIIKITVNCGSG